METKRPSTSEAIERGRFLFLVFASFLLFLSCSFLHGYRGDMESWCAWAKQLSFSGLGKSGSNYPPLFMFWLWLIGKFYTSIRILLVVTPFFKTLVLLPVLLSYLSLFFLLGRTAKSGTRVLSASFLLFAANPALLINGPIWGQVDLIVMPPLLWGIYLAQKPRTAFWLPVLFTFAILTKFQSVALLPVVAALMLRNWRNWRNMLLGLILSIMLVCLVFLPYVLAGDLQSMLRRAYFRAGVSFTGATVGAANLWCLLSGRTKRYDQIPFSDSLERVTQGPLWFLTPQFLGPCFFAILSLVIFIRVLRSRVEAEADDTVSQKPEDLTSAHGEEIWAWTTFSFIAFFGVLTGMHERYLIYSVPCAAIWSSVNPKRFFWFAVLTLLSYWNMMFRYHFGEDFALNILSTLVLLTLFGMLYTLCRGGFHRRFASLVELMGRHPRFCYAYMFGIWLLMALALLNTQIQVDAALRSGSEGPVYLSSIAPYERGTSSFVYNKSLSEVPMFLRKKPYGKGIGTHSPSRLVYLIPSNASSFVADVGLDDAAPLGIVEFKVLLDQKEVWKSGELTGQSPITPCVIDVAGKGKLTLLVDPLGRTDSDYADWADARFVMDATE